jgi:hypothetical protein
MAVNLAKQLHGSDGAGLYHGKETPAVRKPTSFP